MRRRGGEPHGPAGAKAGATVTPSVEVICALVERFLFELAREIAGDASDLQACVSTEVLASIEQALTPYRRSGSRLHPDFGSHAEVRVVEGGGGSAPPRCQVRFTDRSRDRSRPGDPPPRREVRLDLRCRPDGRMIDALRCTVG